MLRGYLKDRIGDALHAISCAAGYNIGWLMRAILRLGLTGLFALVFLASALSARWSNRSTQNVRTLSPATALPSKSSLIAELNFADTTKYQGDARCPITQRSQSATSR